MRANIREWQDVQLEKRAGATIELKVGARVVCTANVQPPVCNGSFGTVVELTERGPVVQFDNGKRKTMVPYEFREARFFNGHEHHATRLQVPLDVAFATTVHKAQGSSFREVVVDTGVFASGQLYTALSRAETPEGLYLMGGISKNPVDEDALEFMLRVSSAWAFRMAR